MQGIADLLRQICRRPRDLLTHCGGEKLAVILPETELAGALQTLHENSPLGPFPRALPPIGVEPAQD